MSLHKIVSCGIKLLIMLKTVLVKIPTFSSIVVFKKALCQLNLLIALFISSVLASFSAKPLANKVEGNKFVS